MSVISGPQGSTSPAAIEARNLCISLSGVEIIHSAHLRISPGESVGIFGPNGSGKSTLVRGLLGIIPHTGTVNLFGKCLGDKAFRQWDRIGYVPQQMAPAGTLPASALEVVKSGLISGNNLFADRGKKARQKAMDALESVGLAHRAHEPVGVFSGGQKHRVLIARALVRRPDLLVLDEPLAGIDHRSREELAEILTNLHSQGLTLTMVLHEMGELGNLVHRRITVEAGHVHS